MAVIGNEVVYLNGVDGAGHPSGVLEPVTATQLVNFAGSAILSTAVSATSNTTLANVGLSAALVAGGTYIFEVYLSVTNNASGGLKLAFSNAGTSSISVADTWSYNNTTVAAQSNITSFASNLVAYTGAVTTVSVNGTIVVTTGGVLALQFAQNASFATATTINPGSFLWLERVS